MLDKKENERKLAISASKPAFNEFMKRMEGIGRFELEIVDVQDLVSGTAQTPGIRRVNNMITPYSLFV
ncbi:hypothetical protein ACFL6I_15255 [candidate division KSB1 bacterium]